MIFNSRHFFILTVVLVFTTLASWYVKVRFLSEADANPKDQVNGRVIYGDDNRLEYYQLTPALQALANSTAALVKSSDLEAAPNGQWTIKGQNFGKTYLLCPSERFSEQNISAYCTGFLVGDQQIVTAGHCIQTEKGCADTKFVFGYSLKHANTLPAEAASDDIYSCKQIVARKQEGAGEDYAVIQLDRPVRNRSALPLRRAGSLQKGDELFVIGHPVGLPIKFADGAKVRISQVSSFFVANLDTYGGNSGSPVFNAQTYEVEGILVRGEADFVYNNGCSISKVCENETCRGEDVTRITAVLPFLSSI